MATVENDFRYDTNILFRINSFRFNKWYEIHRFTEYSIDFELETDADAFRFTISNPNGIYTGLFSKFDEITIEINKKPVMLGSIDSVEYSWDDNGSIIRIEGRDLMSALVDNDAIPGTHKNIKPSTYITNKCMEYGIKSDVDSSIATVDQLIIGCGESEISIINNIVMDSRKRVWFEYDTLHAGKWNDNAQPIYLFTRGIKDKPGIPIKRLTLKEDGTDTKSEVRIYGSTDNGAEKVVGTATNSYMTNRGIKKRMTKRSSNNDSVSKYSANALSDIRDSFRDNVEIEIEVKTGHGGLILPNRTAQIIDTVTKVNAVFFIVGVSYSKNKNNGSITKVTMIPGETAFDVTWQSQDSNGGSFTGTHKMTISELVAQRRG
jgi:prophage tail gpP-like protein